MATLKHINSKNADYGAAEQYLLFEHDEFTMKPVLDETGRLIPREDYRLSTLNCDGEDFAVACMRANLRYQKNQRREDVKSHHYIISFDPRDGPDNGLTVDRAPGRPIRKSAASTDVPTLPCATSNPKSWRCATGRGFRTRRSCGRPYGKPLPPPPALTSFPLCCCRRV